MKIGNVSATHRHAVSMMMLVLVGGVEIMKKLLTISFNGIAEDGDGHKVCAKVLLAAERHK